jgi:cytochrome c oxidase cbb3-type subunit III
MSRMLDDQDVRGMPCPMVRLSGSLIVLSVTLAAAGCSGESRTIGVDLPQTAPTDAQDPRAAKYEGNAYQIGQGGRYFAWYGCGSCHGSHATGALDLSDDVWVHGANLDQVYGFIARGHSASFDKFGERIPTEQLWQITAYVRSLPTLKPERRRRQDVDQTGEPQGSNWSGPVD